MSDNTARKVVNVVRQFGRAKGDIFEAIMVQGLQSRGVPEPRARAAARECSNRIWRNGVVSGAAATVLVGASHANVPAAAAGIGIGVLGAGYTLALDNACRDYRELSGAEVLIGVNRLLSGQ